MLNTVKVINFDLWDAETGEADIVAEFDNSKKIKAFTLDSFQEGEKIEIRASLFCKTYKIFSDELTGSIKNLNDKYEVEVQGKITEVVSNDDDGDYIIVDCGNIFVTVYLAKNTSLNLNTPIYFRGQGRFDIEIDGEEW